jgi:hypothetical protein
MERRQIRSGFAFRMLGLFAAVSLSACASSRSGGGAEDLPAREWQEIPVAQADLNLPEQLPLAISSMHRRSDTKFIVEDFYRFDGSEGIEGYILTVRNPGASLPEGTMLEMRQARLFHAYARQQPETRQHSLKIGIVHGIPKIDSHNVGHYTTAPYSNGKGSCFFARIGFLLSDADRSALPPGAIDTLVQVMLCGDRVDEQQLVAALQKTAIAR